MVVDVYIRNAKAVGVHIYVTEICIVKAGKQKHMVHSTVGIKTSKIDKNINNLNITQINTERERESKREREREREKILKKI